MFGMPWVVKHLVVKRSQARDSYVPAAGFICRYTLMHESKIKTSRLGYVTGKF